MEGVHPCSYVTEDINVCIVGEYKRLVFINTFGDDEPNESNCWNEQNCKNRPTLARFNENSEAAVVTAGPVSTGLVSAGFAINSALALVLSIACLIY